jgi:DNA-3-methyladenine glycosylase
LNSFSKLPISFYNQDTISLAKSLLGKVLVRVSEGGVLSGRIVETEAYLHDDPACHASRGITNRNKPMFGEPGYTYVYFTYGFHHCLNIVASPKGIAEAVLIRALIPIDGIDIMQKNRNKENLKDLCSGPGKLTQALGINKTNNLTKLTSDIIFLADDGYKIKEIIEKSRIGIKEAVDKPWRFYPAELIEWVSKK